MYRILFTIIGLVAVVSAQKHLPRSLGLCSRSNKFNQCVKDKIHSLRPMLRSGDLGDGVSVSKFDPVALDDILIDKQDLRIMMGKIEVKNARSYKVEKFKFDFKKNVIDMLVGFDTMDFRGDYDINMKLSLLRLIGQGKVNASLEGGRCRIRMQGSMYTKNDKEYFKVDYCGAKLKFSAVPIYLDNLFNGNKELSDTGNKVLNENIDLLLADIIPEIEKSLAKIFKFSTNAIFTLAPFDDIVLK